MNSFFGYFGDAGGYSGGYGGAGQMDAATQQFQRDPLLVDTNRAKDKQVGGNHYKSKAIQPWEVIERNGMGFFDGNALKYLMRHKDKGGVEDLKKCIHYIEKLIEMANPQTKDSNA